MRLNDRLKALIAELPHSKNIDGLLVSTDTNIRYLTEFPASESWLLVTKNRVFYITDPRYSLQIRQSVKGVTVKECNQSCFWTVCELIKECRIKRLGFEERQMTVAQYAKLKQFCPRRTKLINTSGVVEGLREIKAPREIQAIRDSLKLHAKALKFLKKVVRPGLSERQVMLKLEYFVKSQGAEFSFPPIIASGPNSCYPHARVTDRIIKNNENVLIDIGIDINGYKSDLTRNFFLGRISPRVKQVFEAATLAQKEAIKLIKPGVSVAEVDLKARCILKKAGLVKYFGHSLGHGVGLDIHETPRLSHRCPTTVLEAGMIVTVEPGVYIPNEFGIRVEDMILVTETGCEVLSGNID